MEVKNGEFIAETELPIDATYQYRYIIDDRDRENDWDADAYFPTEYGVDNSVVDMHVEETVQGLMHFVYKKRALAMPIRTDWHSFLIKISHALK